MRRPDTDRIYAIGGYDKSRQELKTETGDQREPWQTLVTFPPRQALLNWSMGVGRHFPLLFRFQWILAALFLFVLQTVAQDGAASAQTGADSSASSGSIADAARHSKASKAHAKKVISDEDLDADAGPIPRLNLNGPDNSDAIVAAVNRYKVAHTPEQIEEAVHTWYDRYEQMYAAAIQENGSLRQVGDANLKNGYDLCVASQDDDQCEKRRTAEFRSAQSDKATSAKNVELYGRIQTAFEKVRSELKRSGFHYDWFKIRTFNGVELP